MDRTLRKLEHIKYSFELYEENSNIFKNVNFVHNALPEISFKETSIISNLGGMLLKSPVIINAMTGGSDEVKTTNEHLALIARETNLAMAVGSQMAALKDRKYIQTYKITRQVNPKGFIIGNVGSEATVDQAKQAIAMIEANALQIHLNPIQELTMQEGDKNFNGVLDRIQAIREAVDIPVIVKEVGFGISKEVSIKLKERGITIIDIGGKGGTNFAMIESRRRTNPLTVFNNWGIGTVTSLLEVKSVGNIEVIASGGIRNSLHIAKAIGLGAATVGIAGLILKKLIDSNVNSVIEFINQMHVELRLLMTGLGVKNIIDLQKKDIVITGEVKEWCELRNIPISHLARRSE
ncbi:MAG: type 2 isopentenyl-diphosphate Delta-isomerase [Vulcanibacillus sp.]